METDTPFEFAILEFLKEEGFKTSIEPINLGAAVPLSWCVYVMGPIKFRISVTGGIILIEGFSLGTEFGRWDIADPESFDELARTIRDSFQAASSYSDRSMAKRERHLRRCRIG